jgi:hypothetical protein
MLVASVTIHRFAKAGRFNNKVVAIPSFLGRMHENVHFFLPLSGSEFASK